MHDYLMSLMDATEWYKEAALARASGRTRDLKPDAAETLAVDGMIYV